MSAPVLYQTCAIAATRDFRLCRPIKAGQCRASTKEAVLCLCPALIELLCSKATQNQLHTCLHFYPKELVLAGDMGTSLVSMWAQAAKQRVES